MFCGLLNRSYKSFICTSALIAPAISFASSLYVNPVRLVLTPDKRTALLSVRNDGKSPVSFQIRPRNWSQREGADVQSPSDDLVISPPIATVAPGKIQLIRIGPKVHDLAQEHAYRVIIQEIPDLLQGGKVNMVLRFDLPLYVPAAKQERAELRWSFKRTNDRKLLLDAQNPSSSHVEVREIYLPNQKDNPLVFHGPTGIVLAKSFKEWALPASWKIADGSTLQLIAETNVGILHVQAAEGAK